MHAVAVFAAFDVCFALVIDYTDIYACFLTEIALGAACLPRIAESAVGRVGISNIARVGAAAGGRHVAFTRVTFSLSMRV